jgi:hypothetical protein
MPTIFIVGPYRFFFVSLDAGDPPHVHIQRERLLLSSGLTLRLPNAQADSNQGN